MERERERERKHLTQCTGDINLSEVDGVVICLADRDRGPPLIKLIQRMISLVATLTCTHRGVTSKATRGSL